jgi:isopentenyl phosphate kinase
MIELHGPGPMHFIANEALGLIHEMNPLPKAVLEVDFIPLGYGDAIGDTEHEAIIA